MKHIKQKFEYEHEKFLGYIEYTVENPKLFIIIMPQGLRTAEFVEKNYIDYLPIDDTNIYFIELPGIGFSSSLGKEFSYKNFSYAIQTFIKDKSIDESKLVVCGKSTSSVFLHRAIQNGLIVKNLIFIAGPILGTAKGLRNSRFIIKLVLRFFLLRYFIFLFFKLLAIISSIKMGYSNWLYIDFYIQFKKYIDEFNENKISDINTHFILNGRDELMPQKNVEMAMKIYTNHKVHLLETNSHAGPITSSEKEILGKILTSL